MKGLSFEFFKRANFYLVTDRKSEAPSLSIDIDNIIEDFTGDISKRSEIVDFLDKLTPEAPPSRYKFVDKVDPTFSKFGHAEELPSLPPNNKFFWLVAIVPHTDFDPSNGPDKSSIDLQLSGFDDVAIACRGALRAGVFVDKNVSCCCCCRCCCCCCCCYFYHHCWCNCCYPSAASDPAYAVQQRRLPSLTCGFILM